MSPQAWRAQRRDAYRTARMLGRALVLAGLAVAMAAFLVATGGVR